MANMDQLLFMKQFPLVVPNSTFTSYHGIISAGALDFTVNIKVPNYPSLSGLVLECPWYINHLLEQHKSVLKEWVQSSSLYTFLQNLQNLVISLQKEKSQFHRIFEEECLNLDAFKKITAELTAIGFQNIVSISPNFQIIKLKTVDKSERCHVIQIHVGNNYPHHPINIQADIPDQTMKFLMEESTLNKIYLSFIQHVTHLQYIWDELDAIDSQCWVIDPELPTRKDIGRRIVVGTNLSVYIILNSLDARAQPNITFLGPEQMVLQFQQRVAANSTKWDRNNPVVDNLRVIFDLQSFPTKSVDTDETTGNLLLQGECCICYSMRLNDELPSEVCTDTQCSSVFHTDCLFQWLQSVPGNYQSFNYIHGVCPNCGKGISCPVPK